MDVNKFNIFNRPMDALAKGKYVKNNELRVMQYTFLSDMLENVIKLLLTVQRPNAHMYITLHEYFIPYRLKCTDNNMVILIYDILTLRVLPNAVDSESVLCTLYLLHAYYKVRLNMYMHCGQLASLETISLKQTQFMESVPKVSLIKDLPLLSNLNNFLVTMVKQKHHYLTEDTLNTCKFALSEFMFYINKRNAGSNHILH